MSQFYICVEEAWEPFNLPILSPPAPCILSYKTGTSSICGEVKMSGYQIITSYVHIPASSVSMLCFYAVLSHCWLIRLV